MKRGRLAALGLSLLLLVGCGFDVGTRQSTSEQPFEATDAAAPQPDVELSLAHTARSNSRYGQLAERVAEASGGALRIHTFPDGRMGTDSEIVRAVQQGSLSIACASTATYLDLVPEAAILSIPSCFEEYIRPGIVFGKAFVEQMNEAYNRAGFELLWLETGHERVLTSRVPVTRLADLNGLRIRTLDNPYYFALWEALGASPQTGIPFQDLYRALQEGIVDGQENGYPAILSARLYEVQPHVYEGAFFVASNSVVMNKAAWDALDLALQTVIRTELRALDIAEPGVDWSARAREAAPALIIHAMTDDDRALLRETAAPILEQIQEDAGEALLLAMQKEIAALPANSG